ncbi:protein transport protein SEC24 B-like [Silene latifolia]|uniref:protein transport protein SEC24 B-like n=1 Tax=Silene latifolia TaxID=37657 RepID=UPI003D783FE7
MAANVPQGAPRPNTTRPTGPPPGYNPNAPRGPDSSLAQNFQNMQLNQPQYAPQPPSSRPPPPFGQNPPFPPNAAPPASPFGGPSSGYRPGPPPPGAVPRSAMPPGGPPPNMVPPNVAPGRPTSGPMIGQALPFGSRPPPPVSQPSSGLVNLPSGMRPPFHGSQPGPQPSSSRPSGIGSPPLNMGPAPSSTQSHPLSNGPPAAQYGGFTGGPPPVQQQQPPVLGRPPPMAPFGSSMQAGMGPGSPLMGTPSQSPSPFSGVSQRGPPPSFGQAPWQTQMRQVAPSMATSSQAPPMMYGMPPPLDSQNMAAVRPDFNQAGGPMTSKVDPTQIPRPIPEPSIILYETRQNNQANPPPPATVEYIVKDTGNCSPRYMRCTISQIPCTSDILTTSGMQLALLVQPFALPHPSEEPIQVVDFGEGGPLRCARCKGYVNPFMKFIDQGRRFICNLCGFTDETPRDYQCNLGPDGRRRDADERPELCRGTVEFVASKEYMVREPMPAVFFFLVDVSMNAVKTGATAAACSAIKQVIGDLPEGHRTMVGIATFDSTIHFYNLKRALQQPLMLIVPDIQDVYTPLETDVVVQLSECRQHLELLLESIPTMFQSNMTADSAFGAAVKAAFLAMKSTGGKLLVFQSVLPSAGIGALSAREAEGRANVSTGDKEVHKLLQPADKTLREMAIELAEYQVSVDVFLTTQSYVDIASISVVPKTTGGQVYYYFPFSALSDTAKLYNDLRWNVSRPQGFEAVMRVRCSQGLQVQEYMGNFCKRIPTDVDLPAVDCDKTIVVTLKHDDKLQEGTECSFQCAILYTTVYGQRRIRVMTLSLPCTSGLPNLFRSADLDTQFTCFLKQAASEISTTPLPQVRDRVTNHCVGILHSYRKFCSAVQSPGQLILPEALKLLPLYTLALTKSTGLKTDGRIDDRSFWMSYISFVSAPLAVPLVYPRLISVHDLSSEESDGSVIPPSLPLSSEQIKYEGIYLLENGLDALIHVGNSVDPNVLLQLFGVSSVDQIPTQFVLEQYENSLSKKFNEVINEIRRQRCSYLRLQICRSGDPSGMLFMSYMIEDKTPMGLSYVEFLVHIHRHIAKQLSEQ